MMEWPCRKGWGPAVFLAALGLAWVLWDLSAPALAVPQGGYAHGEALLQADELKALLDANPANLKVLDVRHKAKYYLGHLPGALQVWRADIEDKRQPGWLPSAAQVEKLLGRLGVSPEDTLVIYSDQFDHARLWWVLAYYGFPLRQLKLLDGSLEAWKSKGYPTQIAAPSVRRTAFRLPEGPRRTSLMAGQDELKSDPLSGKVILDVRSRRPYLGEMREEGAARPGHIPGARWVEWKEAKEQEGPYKGYFKSAAELKEIYAARGLTPDKDIYLYCLNGQRASLALVALYLAGYPLERLHLYGGSWMEWSRSQEPVATGAEPQS